MKGKTHFAYNRKQVRKQIALRLKAEAEASKLRAQLEQITKEQIANLRRIQEALYTPGTKKKT